jgi:hypothetical protein
VGEALSQWENVDQRLADLFAVFACTPDTDAYTRHAVTRAYGSIIGTANRRATIEAAAEAYFPEWIEDREPIRKELTRILNAAGLAAKRRDDIAHGHGVENVEHRSTKQPSGEVIFEEQLGSFLMPPEYNTGRTHAYEPKTDHFSRFWRARYCYSDEDLIELKMKFWRLEVAIGDYVQVVTPYVFKARTTFPLDPYSVGDVEVMDELAKQLNASKRTEG